MPKGYIDYSNTIIYKIYCNDNTVTDVYVGHTTNFTKRKYQHKFCCSNLNNTLKIYNTIRNYGGWTNWDMIEIAKYNCKDKTEACIKEQYHYEELKASLNSCAPCLDKNKYFCCICNLQCYSKKSYQTHINCNNHKINLMNNDKPDNINKANKTDTNIENKKLHICSYCNFKCLKLSNFETHLATRKHLKLTNTYKINAVSTENTDHKTTKMYECVCGKLYKHRQSLFNHKKKCLTDEHTSLETNNNELKNIKEIKEDLKILMKDNIEMKQMLLDVVNKWSIGYK